MVITTIVITTIMCLIVMYIYQIITVIMFVFEEQITTKKEFLFKLIPFYYIKPTISGFIKKLKNLSWQLIVKSG